MLKLNQKGALDPIVIILLILVLAMGGYIGWTIFKSDKVEAPTETSQETNEAPSTDNDEGQVGEDVESNIDTSGWTTFTSSAGWSMNIPDGWDAFSNTERKNIFIIQTPEYKEGSTAVITETSTGRGGPFALNTGTFTTGDPTSEIPSYLSKEEVFVAKNVEGKKYMGTISSANSGNFGSEGDKVYWYSFTKNGKTVLIMHNDLKNESVINELEAAIKTLQIQ